MNNPSPSSISIKTLIPVECALHYKTLKLILCDLV